MKPVDVHPIEILLIEDSPSDAELTAEALKTTQIRHHLNRVDDGVKAMEFLHRRGTYAEAPRPDLILLDLSLPRKDGREVLVEIKADPKLRTIPVVVLTMSKDEQDVLGAYRLRANYYLIKPVTAHRLVELLHRIELT